MQKIFFLLLSLSSSFVAASEIRCESLFTTNTIDPISADRVNELANLDLSVYPFENIEMKDIRDFSGPNGSLELFLKSQFRQDPKAHTEIFMNLVFLHTGRLASQLEALQYMSPFSDMTHLLRDSKKGDWGAKKNLYQALKSLTSFMVILTGKNDLDLTLRQSWLDLYNAKDNTEFYEVMKQTNDAQHNVAVDVWAGKNVEFIDDIKTQVFTRLNDLGPEHFATARAPSGLFNAVRLDQLMPRLPTLLQELHLPKKQESFYLELFSAFDKMNILGGPMKMSDREKLKSLRKLFLFFQAYLEAFPHKTPKNQQIMMSGAFALGALKTIQDSHRLYQLSEARLEESLDSALKVNAQVDKILEDISTLSARSLWDLQAQEWTEVQSLAHEAESLRINDIGSEVTYEATLQKIRHLEHQLHGLIEARLKERRLESLVDFRELNYYWSRILPEKKYELQGRDYTHVVFHKDVLEFFKKDGQHTGDRFLAALEKGYVGQQNSSGLRSITEIHKDFRYLKVLKSHGKVRLLGKLVDGTLHFYEIYNRTENFDIPKIRHQMESFQP